MTKKTSPEQQLIKILYKNGSEKIVLQERLIEYHVFADAS